MAKVDDSDERGASQALKNLNEMFEDSEAL
jgi:hypothetical protein